MQKYLKKSQEHAQEKGKGQSDKLNLELNIQNDTKRSSVWRKEMTPGNVEGKHIWMKTNWV